MPQQTIIKLPRSFEKRVLGQGQQSRTVQFCVVHEGRPFREKWLGRTEITGVAGSLSTLFLIHSNTVRLRTALFSWRRRFYATDFQSHLKDTSYQPPNITRWVSYILSVVWLLHASVSHQSSSYQRYHEKKDVVFFLFRRWGGERLI